MRIAIVNDLVTAVEALRRILASVPDYQLAWVAWNGAEAVERCARDTPDLILMDLVMPVMDGTEATRRIMAQSPCAILVVTASVELNTAKVFETLGAGALDAVSTPVLGPYGDAGGAEVLLSKIRIVQRLISREHRHAGRPVLHPNSGQRDFLVGIGASAGGPAALATILSHLPHNLPAALVIVQHIDAEFAPAMATWLDEQSNLPVRIAHEGDRPQMSTALLAASNDHLVLLDTQTLGYRSDPVGYSYRPSVDVFFESVARHQKKNVVAVLLTGMGRDGAKGLKLLREAGAVTIAQDRASSVVYGMPKAAAELDAAVEILPLDAIAPRLVQLCTRPITQPRANMTV